MKYKRMLETNMVPEWRNQYIDYFALDSALTRAIESKNAKSRERGIDLYSELIRFDQKFSSYFSRECQRQLDKINAFHHEKLVEMRGKYRNLQDQLEQVLSSAVYREIQPNASRYYLDYDESSASTSASNYNTVTSVTDLFRSLKEKLGQSPSKSPGNTLTISGGGRNNVHPPLIPDQLVRANREKVSSIARKLSESFSQSTTKLTSSITNLPDQVQLPKISIKSRRESRQFADSTFVGHQNNQNENIQQTLAGATSQSRKKIIARYRIKINHLKFAFQELYFNLVLFEQYTQLNHSGFEQLLRKHDRMFASTLGRKFYQEHVQTADFYNDLQAIDQLIEGVEHIYTLHFENGNRRKAIEKLQVPASIYRPSSPMLDFRVGFELGCFAILFIAVLFIGYFSDTGYDWRTVFRLYRSPLLIIIFLFQAAISIIIWKHYKINHVLIFELNPREHLSSQHFIEYGSLLGIVWSLSVILFHYSTRLAIRPSVCPLVVVLIIFTYLLNPTATCHHRARFWLLSKLGRIFTAPFHPVRFADFWVADQLVSIVPLFLDLEYLSCFYTTDDILSVSHLSADNANRCVTRKPHDLVIRTIVAALPAWFRCTQCLRRWHDENWLRQHLANACKYACMSMTVVISSIAQANKNSFELDTMRIIWIVAAIFTSSLTAWWDIIYDFGLFNSYDNKSESEHASLEKQSSVTSRDSFREFSKKKKPKEYPFLRKELVYPVWVYYFAIIEDWILRFGWIITASLTEFSNIEAGLVVSLLAPLEMFRRFVWNCIRLENEQLNNCGLFRAVRDIPLEVVAPIDESHLDKVIMMMDSRDGPAMRNRLMKRRTLRPDRVSFMIIQQHDSSRSITKRSDLRI